MSRQQYPQFLFFVSVVLQGQDKRSKRIVGDDDRDRYLDLVSLCDLSKVEHFTTNFVVIGVKKFAFHLLEDSLPVVGQMKQQTKFIWFLKLRNHPDFEPIGLMQQFLVLETGPFESDLELFVQNLEVRETFDAFTLVFEYLQFP